MAHELFDRTLFCILSRVFFERAADYKRLYKFISRVLCIICIEFIYIYNSYMYIYKLDTLRTMINRDVKGNGKRKVTYKLERKKDLAFMILRFSLSSSLLFYSI